MAASRGEELACLMLMLEEGKRKKKKRSKNVFKTFCISHFDNPVTTCGYSHLLDWRITARIPAVWTVSPEIYFPIKSLGLKSGLGLCLMWLLSSRTF